MNPIIAKIGPITVYSYGLMVALGFGIAIFLAQKSAPGLNINKDKVVDFGIFILLGGLLGARIAYVITNLRYYMASPMEIFDLTKGGLIWYGGFLGGLIVGLVFVKKNSINFWDGADLFAPFMALAQSIGRIGCFLNGCCYGSIAPAYFPLGVAFPNEPFLRHPVQLYESFLLLLLFFALRQWQRYRRFKGEIFLGYAFLYSISRFFLEFLRADNPKGLAGLTMAQAASIVIMILSASIFISRFILWKKRR